MQRTIRNESVEQAARFQKIDEEGQLPKRGQRRFGIPLDMHRAGKTVEVYARRRTLVFNWRLLTRWVKRWDGEIVCHAPNNATIHAKYKVANCRF